jgi:hypothetical protein
MPPEGEDEGPDATGNRSFPIVSHFAQFVEPSQEIARQVSLARQVEGVDPRREIHEVARHWR